VNEARALAVIPARGGSKRVRRKNLRLLGGKPLLAWSIEAARNARSLGRIVVSSEDDEILAVAAGYDRSYPLTRPVELATDLASGVAVVQHALSMIEPSEGRYEVVVILQCTSPFATGEDIDGCIELLRRTGADSAVSVVKVAHDVHPAKLKTMNGDRLLPYLEEERGRMAEHELPDVYVRNTAIYAARRTLVDEGRIVGDDCRGYVMPRDRSVDINDELDLAFAEFLFARSRP
jgi:CMP-N,N'-diacetyllegionaminic acid synthase